jgi:putative membrane protein insertion efficiency factor
MLKNPGQVSVCILPIMVVGVLSLSAIVGAEEDRFADLCTLLLKNESSPPDSATPIVPENEPSEPRMFSQVMVRLYQELISSQQNNVCVFSPSCSHFGMESVSRCGFLKGVVLTADRLQRCNTFAAHYGYGYDPATGRLLDPLTAYDGYEPTSDTARVQDTNEAP